MKTRILLLSVALMVTSANIKFAYSQQHMLTFSASGQSNEISEIMVKNINQQTTVSLNGSDTLVLMGVVGIDEHLIHKDEINVYPNPSYESISIVFSIPSQSYVGIEIIDLFGKVLSTISVNLHAGVHRFNVSGLSNGIYFVRIHYLNRLLVQRIISMSKCQSCTVEIKKDFIETGFEKSEFKDTRQLVFMQYNTGDRLVIKAVTGIYSHTKSLIPILSENIDFNFLECSDFDGNHYGVVTIGNQIWMVENLKTTTYKNGIAIENPDGYYWEFNTTGAYAWWGNEISLKDKFGALYNWYAVNNINGLCPEGWHIPDEAEWTELTDFVGGTQVPNGSKLKSCRQAHSPLGGECNVHVHPHWYHYPNRYGTDDYGFSGYPGGSRSINGGYSFIGTAGGWWSIDEYGTSNAWSRTLFNSASYIAVGNLSKAHGISVRCLKD